MKQIVLNNTLVAYQSCLAEAAGEKKSLVFLHGWGAQGNLWEQSTKLIRQQNKNLDIYYLDFPGFGASPVPSEAYNLSDYCEIVRQFVQKLEIADPILIGHSFGGRVSIKIAGTDQAFAQKLILVDSAGFVVDSPKKKTIGLMAKISKPFFKPKFMQPLKKNIYQKIGAEDYVATPELQKTFVNIINEDLSQYLPKIEVSTLLIWGEKDEETPPEFAHKLKANIRNSELVILPEAGHYSFIDQPQKFSEKILEFV